MRVDCWDAVATFVMKLRSLRSKLRAWNRLDVGNITQRKNSLLEKITHFDSEEEKRELLVTKREERYRMKNDLDLVLEREEAPWRQRASVEWLNNGDRNTRFFHAWASYRKWKNFILDLQLEGKSMTDQQKIPDCFQKHFKGILGNPQAPFIKADWKMLYLEGALQLDELEASSTADEVKKAVFSIESQKIPRARWVFLCILQAVLAHYENGYDASDLYLLHEVVKIISKTLSLRLAKKLDRLIAPSQSTFIRGGTLADDFMAASEIISQARKFNRKDIVYKSDFEKAFDNVAWPFLLELLEARGFSSLRNNFEKSTILGIGISESHRNWIARTLGSRPSDFPLKYLGMPLCLGKPKMNEWNMLTEKITKKLADWKGKLLSIVGRALLLNVVITRIMPKQFGGLGITNLKTLNQTLLCKWWWNLFTNDKKPWSAVIKTNYYRDRPVSLKPLIRKNLSEFWKQVYSVKDIFQSMVKFQVGTGSQLSFWDDTLLLDQPTKKSNIDRPLGTADAKSGANISGAIQFTRHYKMEMVCKEQVSDQGLLSVPIRWWDTPIH
ncbi:uncharacterized protein [Elaeis guineensis]|uniref:uncharacterized protein n=1 Tax=Elaeis guineensis var. tenera TaxID=51953 RepID=UPI003C6D0B00